jgi:outer membrane protein TolC
LAVIAGVVFVQACVPANAGYQDVRRMTSSRIQRDVRWHEHDSVAAADLQTRELLARPLNAEAAVQIALLNNHGLQGAFEELGIARAGLVHALRMPNPTVDAALRFKGSATPAIDVLAMEDLSELLFIPMRSGVAGARMDAAKATVAGRVLDVAFEVRIGFYAYQAAAQNCELYRTVLEAVRGSFDAAKRLHEAGNITDLSFANDRALYEESRVAYTRAEATSNARRETLNALMGLWGKSAQWTAETRLPDPAPIAGLLEKLEQRAVERSLDLELIRHRFEAAAKRANLSTLRGWVPELKAGVSAERGDDGGGWAVGPAAALEVPLFYQGQGESGAALSEARQQQKIHADIAVRIRAAARSAATQLQAAAKSAEYFRSTLLPLREEIVKGTQLEYNAMSVGIFQLLQAKRDQIAAAQTYVELLQEYWTLRAEVEQLLAGRLPRSGLTADEAVRDATSLEQGRGGGLRQH